MVDIASPDSDRSNGTGLALALERMGSNSDRQEVYSRLLDCNVLVPTLVNDQTKPTQANVAVITTTEGNSVVLGFSSSQAADAWSSDTWRFESMNGTQIARLAQQNEVDSVVLDVGSRHQLALAPAELDALADGRVPAPFVQDASSQSHVSRQIRPTLANWPAPAIEQLRKVARDHNEVAGVYLFDISYNNGDPLPAIGIRFHSGASEIIDHIMTEIAAQLPQQLPKGAKVDILVIDDDLFAAFDHRIETI